MDKDNYSYGGWLVAVRGDDPTVIYAATFDSPEDAVEAVSQRRGERQETYEAIGRFLSNMETVRDLPPGVAVPLA
jgi:hypothetical protein